MPEGEKNGGPEVICGDNIPTPGWIKVNHGHRNIDVHGLTDQPKSPDSTSPLIEIANSSLLDLHSMTLLLPIIVLYYRLEVLWGHVNHSRGNTGQDRKFHD